MDSTRLIVMENYKRGSHTVWDCNYHLVWTTKYRYPVLAGDVGQRCRELLREIARSQEMVIYAGSINRDHVHMLLGIPPQISVSRSVQYLKGKSSHKLLSEYGSLCKRYWGQHLWGEWLLGGHKWQCDRCSLEKVHRGAKTLGARR